MDNDKYNKDGQQPADPTKERTGPLPASPEPDPDQEIAKDHHPDEEDNKQREDQVLARINGASDTEDNDAREGAGITNDDDKVTNDPREEDDDRE
ncbi:MAG TPA: hypothetical protein VK907_07865 [Phnomibacter sp.]|nr:hypothetical protein [Phnomibacter sp.]